MSRTAGFRCSWSDVAVLVAMPPATWWLWSMVGPIAGVMPFAVGHFFLFCNVFRIQRGKELLWAACCVLNVAGWAFADRLEWAWILAAQTPLTVALIGVEMRQPSYHGLMAHRINPCLANYLAGQEGKLP